MLKKKGLAIASGGGHWKQLMLLRPGFEMHDMSYVTTIRGLPELEQLPNSYIVRDSNAKNKISLCITFIQLAFIMMKVRPKFVITTGAAPGMLAVFLGRLFFAKTIWIDSIANANELSLGGKLAKRFAEHTLTQWPELAHDNVEHKGSVF